MTMTFAGKRVVVTGASSGIGQAAATILLEQGAQVICVGRKKSGLQAIADRFPDMAIPLAADLSSAMAIEVAGRRGQGNARRFGYPGEQCRAQ